MTGTATLICPKCRGAMRTYERNGVLIDQCEECRGIFLDRGELERLIDAEGDHDTRKSREHEGGHHDDDDRNPPERNRKRRTSPASLLQDFLGGGE